MGLIREIFETVNKVRYQKPQPKFCPKCGSHKIYQNPSMGIFPTKYRCSECGYEGHIVIELETEQDL